MTSLRVLALNCGSSSIKSALVEAGTAQRLLDVRVENVGAPDACLHVDDVATAIGARRFDEVVELVLGRYRDGGQGVPDAVAHRIVHGGKQFRRPTSIDADALSRMDPLGSLAPLHNPPALAAVRQSLAVFPDVPQIAVFDTAFHATLPAWASEYALPRDLARRCRIRRFGFHGINHAHVMSRVAAHLRVRPEQLRLISCHLGNGASVTAIENGRSVETSMGMTPLEGLVMGTRAGDLDPGVLLHLLHSGELDLQQLDAMLNSRSGLAGLTGSNDMREIERRAASGDEECQLAIALYTHRLRKYVGAYAATLGGVDVIAFTGGIGENSALIRQRSTQRLEILGAQLDEQRNRDARVSRAGPVAEISSQHSRVRLLVVQADEELEMACQAAAVLANGLAHGPIVQ